MLILDGEVKVGKGSHPSMPAGIEVRGGEEIGKRVVVSPYDKRLVDEILFKVVHNGPLEGEELGLARVIIPLSLSQRSTPISNGM